MTIARRLFSLVSAAGLALTLAACSTSGPGGGSIMGGDAAPKGVAGNWIDAQGTGLSTLSGGVFQTVATDTGQKLAEGSYVSSGQNAVQITGTSLIRQSPIGFNCLLVSTNQLNCTSANNQQFVLTRRV